MSKLKFTCPACGQPMECEKAYCGDQTRCLNCDAELRIPFTHTPPEPQTLLPHAELISRRPAEPAPQDDSAAAATKPPEPPASRPATQNATSDLPLENSDLRCICPVCQSELQVSAGTLPQGEVAPPVAHLISRGMASHAHSGTPHSDGACSSLKEREGKIAAAREANPVQVNPTIKPRMSYILSGGAKSDSADGQTPPKPQPESLPDPFAE